MSAPIARARAWITPEALFAVGRVLVGGYAAGVGAFFLAHNGAPMDRAILFNALGDLEQRHLRVALLLGMGAAVAYIAWFAVRGRGDTKALVAASYEPFLLAPLGLWPLYEASVQPHVRILAASAVAATFGAALHLFATRSPRAALLDRIDAPLVGKIAAALALTMGLAHGSYMASIAVNTYTILFSGWDLAIFSQIHWNITTSGVPWSTIYTDETFNHYAIHFSPILHLTSLLYLLHRSPATLYVIENVALGLGAWPLFALARRLTGQPGVALLLAASYLLNPCAPGIGFHEFHEIAVFPLIMLALLWAIETERRTATWIFFALALMVREDIGAYLAVLGVYYGLTGRRDIAKKMVPLSLTYLVVVNVVVMPLLRGKAAYVLDHRFDGLFRAGSVGLGTTVETVLTNPLYVVEYIVSYPEKWRFLALVLLPVLGLPFATRRTAMLVIPGILFSVLSSFTGQYWIDLHYTAQLIPLLYFATTVVIASFGSARPRVVVAATVLVATCLFAGKFGRNPVLNGPLIHGEVAHHAQSYGAKAATYHALAAKVPKEACVRATGNLLVMLAERRHAYIVPWGKMCDWAFIDYGDQARQEPSTTPAERAWVLEKLRSNEFGVVYGDDRVVLMSQGKPTDQNAEMIARIEKAGGDATVESR